VSIGPAGTATAAARTRVEITHAGWERLGTRGGAWRERNQQGWATLLPHYRAAVGGDLRRNGRAR
jgi:hypothetical protein